MFSKIFKNFRWTFLYRNESDNNWGMFAWSHMPFAKHLTVYQCLSDPSPPEYNLNAMRKESLYPGVKSSSLFARQASMSAWFLRVRCRKHGRYPDVREGNEWFHKRKEWNFPKIVKGKFSPQPVQRMLYNFHRIHLLSNNRFIRRICSVAVVIDTP